MKKEAASEELADGWWWWGRQSGYAAGPEKQVARIDSDRLVRHEAINSIAAGERLVCRVRGGAVPFGL